MNSLEVASVVLVVWGIALAYFGVVIISSSGRSIPDEPVPRMLLTLGIACGIAGSVLFAFA
jgi:VIT1/CCC1 family predicted Fe2+/Mn2+ transporter